MSETRRNITVTGLVFCLCLPYVLAINRTATTGLILVQGLILAVFTPILLTGLAKRQKCLIADIADPKGLGRRIGLEWLAVSGALIVSILVLYFTTNRTLGQLIPIHLWTAMLPVYVLFSLLTVIQFVMRPKVASKTQIEYLNKIHAILRGERVVLNVMDIEVFASEKHETVAYVGLREYICEQSLSRLAQRLDPQQFIRCHRSFIINIAAVKSFPADLTSIVTVCGRTADVSKRCRVQVKKALRAQAK